MSYREKHTPAICIAIIAALNLGFYSMGAPVTRALELSACREYYLIHDPSVIQPGAYVEESLCKIDSIQKRVAWFNALISVFHFCADFIVTIPRGFLADRIGRKPVLLLNLGGLTLAWSWTVIVCYFRTVMPTKLVLLGPIFTLIGGSSHFNTALVYGEAATYTNPNQRTAIFSFFEATIQVSQLVAPVMSSSLMQFGVFVPFSVSIPLFWVAILLVFLLPNRHVAASKSLHDGANIDRVLSNQPLLGDDSISLVRPIPGGDIDDDDPLNDYAVRMVSREPALDTIKIRFLQAWQNLREFGKMFMDDPVARYALASFLVFTLGKQSLHVLIQYVSKRFGTTIAQAAYLFSIKAGVVLFVFSVVLPCAKQVKTVPIQRTNVWLAKASIVLLTVGVLWMGLAWSVWTLIPGLVIYAGGFGFTTLIRTLATANVEEEQIGKLYSGLAMAETVGSLSGTLFVTTAFTQSISAGGWWAGIPYLSCSLFYGFIAIYTWIIDTGKSRD